MTTVGGDVDGGDDDGDAHAQLSGGSGMPHNRGVNIREYTAAVVSVCYVWGVIILILSF